MSWADSSPSSLCPTRNAPTAKRMQLLRWHSSHCRTKNPWISLSRLATRSESFRASRIMRQLRVSRPMPTSPSHCCCRGRTYHEHLDPFFIFIMERVALDMLFGDLIGGLIGRGYTEYEKASISSTRVEKQAQ